MAYDSFLRAGGGFGRAGDPTVGRQSGDQVWASARPGSEPQCGCDEQPKPGPLPSLSGSVSWGSWKDCNEATYSSGP